MDIIFVIIGLTSISSFLLSLIQSMRSPQRIIYIVNETPQLPQRHPLRVLTAGTLIALALLGGAILAVY